MSDELFKLPFSEPGMDRAGEHRKDTEWIDAARRDPDTRVLLLHDDQSVPVNEDGGLSWCAPKEIESDGDWIFLGIAREGGPLFALEVTEDGSQSTRVSLRDVGPTLSPADADAAVQAVALANWHRRHRFCAFCGQPTVVVEAGHVRHCDACGSDHFPRTDPAVIMLVSDGDRCVLGRRIGAPTNRWSTLAGFVEPGETPEATVAREVFEEVGLRVESVRYRGSQPWPFPSSLMLAYEATASYQPLTINDEHHEVRWFTRSQLTRGMADKTIAVPGAVSAGSALIRNWLG